jgi:hypothetical protein
MKKKVLFLTLCLCSLFFISCEKQSYKEELKQLLSDESAYSEVVEVKEFKIKATYLPLRYFELRELTSFEDSLLTKEKIAEIKKKTKESYGNGLYFIVNLANIDPKKDILYGNMSHFGEWSEQLQKFLFRMKDYIYLETAQHDEILLSVYDFQRTFGYTKDRSMLLCFPKVFNDKEILSDDSKFLKMHIKDWGWGIGRQRFKWDVGELIKN